MKIQNYDLALSSQRVYMQKDQETEELREWGTQKNTQKTKDAPQADPPERHGDRVSLSNRSRHQGASPTKYRHVHKQQEAAKPEDDEDQGLDSRMMTLKRMIEAFTGKEIKLTHVRGDNANPSESVPDQDQTPPPSQETDAPPEQEWGMSYSHYESHYESEQTSFSASGTVNTADGKQISFAMNLQMSREYFSEERLTVTAGAPMVDPLVINYAGNASQLEDMTFEFDLNSNGSKDNLHQLAPGSGFLVFDRNADGKINDGSELFGPTTGDGFSELSAYDDDKNNWIDENDTIYTKLSLWRRENGVDYLQGLKAANVGAIYLGNADTSFDLTDQNNDLLGRIQKTGVYLKEDGGSGTVQQIDFSA